MKKLIFTLACLLTIAGACKKSGNKNNEAVVGSIKQVVETGNGITYKIFTDQNTTTFKGILVMGSGNDENNPSAGALDGAAETALCQKAAANGYAAAIVQYSKPPANTQWNDWSKLLGEDFNKCIVAIAGKYGIDKNKSVVGGISYASFMLLTNNGYYNSLPYCKGILAACGATGSDQASKFHIPVFSIACSGNNEGDYSGKQLFDQIPANSPIKSKSAGVTDSSCSVHCGGNWTDQMYTQMVKWLQ